MSTQTKIEWTEGLWRPLDAPDIALFFRSIETSGGQQNPLERRTFEIIGAGLCRATPALFQPRIHHAKTAIAKRAGRLLDSVEHNGMPG